MAAPKGGSVRKRAGTPFKMLAQIIDDMGGGLNSDVVIKMMANGTAPDDVVSAVQEYVKTGYLKKQFDNPDLLSTLASGHTRMAERTSGKSVKRAAGMGGGSTASDKLAEAMANIPTNSSTGLDEAMSVQEKAQQELDLLLAKRRAKPGTPLEAMNKNELRLEAKAEGLSTEGSDKKLIEKVVAARKKGPATTMVAPPTATPVASPVIATGAGPGAAATPGEAVSRYRGERQAKAAELLKERAAEKATKMKMAGGAATEAVAPVAAAGGMVPPTAPPVVTAAAAGGEEAAAGAAAKKGASLLSKEGVLAALEKVGLSKGVMGLFGKAFGMLGPVVNVATLVWMASDIIDKVNDTEKRKVLAGLSSLGASDVDSAAAGEQTLGRMLDRKDTNDRANQYAFENMRANQQATLEQIAGHRMQAAMMMSQQSQPSIDEILATMRAQQ